MSNAISIGCTDMLKRTTVLLYALLCLAVFAQDTDTLRRELTIAQTLVNNVLQFVAFNFSTNRNQDTVKSFNLFTSDINPIDTVKYGYVASNPYCVTSGAYQNLSASEFNPCLVYDYPSHYAVEIRFKGSYASGNSLSTNLYQKYILFLAFNIDGQPIINSSSGALSAVNSKISYFVCYNPTTVSSFIDAEGNVTARDYINNGIRAGGNTTSSSAVTSLSTADSKFGGIASCLSAESSL